MVEWKWVKWGLLSAILLVLLQYGTVVNGQAASSGIYREDVTKDSHFKRYYDQNNPDIGAGLLDGPNFDLRRYPTINAINADYVDSGRLTTNTKNIMVDLRDRASIKYYPGQASYEGLISKYRAVLMTGGNFNGVIMPVTVIAKSETKVADIASGYSAGFQTSGGYNFSVDLSKMSKLLPIHVGFQLQSTKNPNHWTSYYVGSFTTDGILAKPTIDDGLRPDSTQVTGTGIPGSVIRSDINDATAEVDANGKYTLNLGSDLKDHLLAKPEITVTQHNQFGDFSEASQKQLKMSKAENNPAFHIEDNLSYPEGATDDEVLNDLRRRLEIQVDDEQLQVQYESPQQNLAAFINSQAWGTTIEVPIYAKSPGYIQSNSIIVKITKKMENVIFTNQKDNLYFPNHALPLKNDEIWSDDIWKLSVVDSRVIDKKPWTLTAIATKSTKNSDKQDLSPYLWYADGPRKLPLNQLVTILDSQKTTPVSDVDGSKVYEQVFDQTHGSGIIIKANPQMPTGAYEATITWTLQMGP